MKPEFGVGIVGYGTSTKVFHLPYIRSVRQLQIKAFLQRSAGPKAQEAEAGAHCTIDFPDVTHYRELDEFLLDDRIDLVIICTTPDTHADIAIKCLNAKKNVVVEKPFTITTEEADKVIEAASSNKVLLTVYQSTCRNEQTLAHPDRRYDSDFLTLKRLVEENVMGEILEAEFHHDLSNPPWLTRLSQERRPGYGMAYTAGSHVIDQALSLFGMPKTITGFFQSFRGLKSANEDSYTITMEYESGLIIHVKTHAVSIQRKPLTYFVRGRDGSFVKFGTDPQLSQSQGGGLAPNDINFGLESPESWGTLTTLRKCREQQVEIDGFWEGKIPSERGNWAAFYIDLVDGMISGRMVINPKLSRAGILVIELAWESVQSGRKMTFAA